MKKARKEHLHFMGIRGSGISYAANLARLEGFKVNGCDKGSSDEFVRDLKKARIPIWEDHNVDHLDSVDLLITSAAIADLDPDNPELTEAEKRKIPSLSWQKFVAGYLMKDKYVIAIAGTHGKGTTTAMLGLIMEDVGLDPTVALGAVVPRWGRNYRKGNSKYFVIEADEFNDNFLNYNPDQIVITNIDMDHPEYFQDFDSYLRSFEKFIDKLTAEPKSILILNADDSNTDSLKKKFEGKVKNILDFSIKSRRANFASTGINTNNGLTFHFSFEQLEADFKLSLFGLHNVSNATAALAAVLSLGGSSSDIISIAQETLGKFSGAQRRFEISVNSYGLTIVDDYAHHPTEIAATLEAAREKFPKKKIYAVFQPHMYTRTKYLFEDFIKVFRKQVSNEVIITDIYAAREQDKGEVSSQALVEKTNTEGVKYIPGLEEVVSYLKNTAKRGDVVLVMGAGNVNEVSKKLISERF